LYGSSTSFHRVGQAVGLWTTLHARDLTATSSASVTVNELLSVTSSLRHDILAPLHAASG
jgi:hypothetical protein